MVHCVNSIADLKVLGAGAFPCIRVLGYDTPGDGGEGDFFWDGSFNVNLIFPDGLDKDVFPDGQDGGIVIRPKELQPSQVGRWRRMFVDRGAVSVRWYGAVGDGVTDDTDAINNAEKAVSLYHYLHRFADLPPIFKGIRGILLFPPGIYIINGAANDIKDGSKRKYGIEKRNTKWVGSGYVSSILKLKDNSTKDKNNSDNTVDSQMIYANASLSDIGFYHLGFDLNGEKNNLTEQANVAAIWFDGQKLEVNGMVVEDCKFSNGPGGTVILVQNRAPSWINHSSEYPLNDVLIRNNRFEDNCLSPVTNDHSTINIWARRTRVTGNIFRQTNKVPRQQRYHTSTAIEFHGADGLFLGNSIHSYGSVVIASENFIEPWENLLVANNMVSDLGMYFTQTAVGTSTETKPIDKIVLRGNHVVFNNYIDTGISKAGLMQIHGKPISYIEVSDNYFEMAFPNASIWPTGVSSPNIEKWAPLTPYSIGTLILDTKKGNIQQVINQGKSAEIEPTWDSTTADGNGGLKWQNIGLAGTPRITYTTVHLKISGNTFNKMQFGAWVDNWGHYDQVKNLEFANNTCLNLQNLQAGPECGLQVWD